MAAHDDDELPGVVVEQEEGALHRAEPAARLAQPVVEVAPRLGRAVERAQELDDHVERVGARREGLLHALLYLVSDGRGYACVSDRRSVCSEVRDTSRT